LIYIALLLPSRIALRLLQFVDNLSLIILFLLLPLLIPSFSASSRDFASTTCSPTHHYSSRSQP
ncbi:hypothetical protein PMAYCL1PPCAC_11755, partial [Pristionchus mayeri]